jgi:hypothetical protein
MSTADQIPTRRRIGIVTMLLAAFVTALMMFGLRASDALANHCTTGYVCVYTGIGFSGAEGLTVCGAEGVHPFAGFKSSGMNHCANRSVWFRTNGVTQTCREAGGQVESSAFNEIWIGALGSHC